MSTNAYYRTGLTGDAATDLDNIAVGILRNDDFAMVSFSGDFYIYKVDIDSAATANSPYIIEPATTPGDVRWIQQSVPWASDSGSMFLSSSLIKEPAGLPWNVGEDDQFGLGYIKTPSSQATVGYYYFNTEDAWDTLASFGDTAQVTVNATYATIASVASGSGTLTNLVLPGVAALGQTVSVQVTVDGSAYELTFTTENVTDRFCAGKVITHLDYAGRGQSEAIWHPDGTDSGLVSGLAFRHVGGAGDVAPLLCTPTASLCGSPCIRFETSLLVEMKAQVVSATTYRDYGAAIYTLDQ